MWPTSLTVDILNDRLYILDIDVIYSISLNTRIGRIVMGTFAECEQMRTLGGDLLPQRPLAHARSITVAPDSTLYIAETNNKRVNQVWLLAVIIVIEGRGLEWDISYKLVMW